MDSKICLDRRLKGFIVLPPFPVSDVKAAFDNGYCDDGE